MTHELKCWPEFFGSVIAGQKRFEFRLDDRGFKVGDRLVLREWVPLPDGDKSHYTGRRAEVEVVYLLVTGSPNCEGRYHVIMSIERVEPEPPPRLAHVLYLYVNGKRQESVARTWSDLARLVKQKVVG